MLGVWGSIRVGPHALSATLSMASQESNRLRDLFWIIGALFASTALYVLSGQSVVFTLVGVVGAVHALLILFAEYRERKRYRELEDLNYEARRRLLEDAGRQGLVKRSPPANDGKWP